MSKQKDIISYEIANAARRVRRRQEYILKLLHEINVIEQDKAKFNDLIPKILKGRNKVAKTKKS